MCECAIVSRALRIRGTVVFILLSSSSSQMEVAEGRQAAVVDYFTARFHAERLSQSFAVHCVRSAHILTPSLFHCFIDRLACHTFQT